MPLERDPLERLPPDRPAPPSPPAPAKGCSAQKATRAADASMKLSYFLMIRPSPAMQSTAI
jgi:hypothetical protein